MEEGESKPDLEDPLKISQHDAFETTKDSS